jgi:hypothetical protein
VECVSLETEVLAVGMARSVSAMIAAWQAPGTCLKRDDLSLVVPRVSWLIFKTGVDRLTTLPSDVRELIRRRGVDQASET